MRRIGQATPIAALISLVLAGCSDAEDTADDSSSSSTSSPTASETDEPASTESTPPPEAPELPAEATEHTEAGAEAFVRHYIDLINHAQATGDAEPTSAAIQCGLLGLRAECWTRRRRVTQTVAH